MSLKNNTSQKIISALLIISIIAPSVLFSMPKRIQAQGLPTQEQGPLSYLRTILTGTGTTAGVTNTAISVKNVAKEILRQILMTVARKLLQDMTKSTVNWINSGFHGSPLFLQNPESFFKDIAKFEIRTMVDLIGYDPLQPFGKGLALDIIAGYKGQLVTNLQYSLGKVMTDPVLRYNYQNNFNVGGWNGFLINTQYPQNNYLGYRMMATEALAKKLQGTVQNAAQKVQTTLQQGMGFLSPQKCVTNPNYNSLNNQFRPPKFNNDAFIKANPYNPPDCSSKKTTMEITLCGQQVDAYRESYKQKAAAATASFDDKDGPNNCPNKPDGSSGLEATTPGSVVANQITTALGIPMNSTLQAMGLGNSISAVFDALLNKFLGDGLNALASKVNPKPAPDTWSYEGQTLGSPADGTNTGWDAGPDEPIILSDFRKKIEGKTVTTGSILLGTCTFGSTTIDSITQAACLALSLTAGTINGGIATRGASWTANPDETTLIKEEIGNIHGCTYDGKLKKWCSSTEYTYIPGDIENTKAELQLIYNENPTNPGITQLQSRLWLKSRELDMCQPGPDLGWKDRMTEEMNRNSLKLQGKTSDSDGNLAAEAQLTLKELKFAVAFFKDWINNKMMTALPNSVIYMDAVEEIGTLSQQANELTDKKRIKNQALARLESIKTGLESITSELNALPEKPTQPEVGSSQEATMVSFYKQYKATADAISNPTSLDNMFNELTVTLEKLAKLTELMNPTNPKGCPMERAAAKWTGSAGATSTKGGETEKNIYCDAPIKGGYNHESFTHNKDAHGGFFSGLLGAIFAIPTGGLSLIPGTVGSVLTREGTGVITHKEIPYVNARNVLKWKGALKLFSHSASIQMSCNIIWKANILDYKGNLSGTPETANIVEPYLPGDTSDTSLGTCTINKTDTSTTGTTEMVGSDSNMTFEDCVASDGTNWVPNTPIEPVTADPSFIPAPTPVGSPTSLY